MGTDNQIISSKSTWCFTIRLIFIERKDGYLCSGTLQKCVLCGSQMYSEVCKYIFGSDLLSNDGKCVSIITNHIKNSSD